MISKRPNLFVVGAPKCGTTSIANYLSNHPDVFMCHPKEPFYFSEDYPILRKRFQLNSESDYLNLFRSATSDHKIIAEASTNYLRSEVAIANALKFNPEAKFIAILRNPIEVVQAFHAELINSGIETVSDFQSAWNMQESRESGADLPEFCEAPQFLQYAKVASFFEQIQRFYDLVPREQRMVLFLSDLKENEATVYRSITDFLGVSEYIPAKFVRSNGSHTHRFPTLAKYVQNPPKPLRPVVEKIRLSARKIRCLSTLKTLLQKPVIRATLNEEFYNELKGFFQEDVLCLSNLLEKNLTHWTETSQSQFPKLRDSVARRHPSPEIRQYNRFLDDLLEAGK